MDIKISKLDKEKLVGIHSIGDIKMDIKEVNKHDNHIEVFLRAHNKNKQLGFGTDGSVDIERFLFFNPPTLVDDQNGDIEIIYTEMVSGVKQIRILKENPVQATLNGLERAIKIAGKENTKIIDGKIGSTVTTFYACNGAENIYFGTTTWNGVHNSVFGYVGNYPLLGQLYCKTGKINSADWRISRFFIAFDTSSLGVNNTITGAVLNIKQGNLAAYYYATRNVGIVGGTQLCPPNNLAGDDYSRIASTRFATDVTCIPNQVATRTWTFNEYGISWISKTGYTKLVGRVSLDIDNTTPTDDNNLWFYGSINAGTSNDPNLVVTHSGALISGGSTTGVSTITGINTLTL